MLILTLARGVMVLSAVGIGRRIIRSEAQALQCPQRARGGCPLRPDGFRRSSPYPRPGGKLTVSLLRYGYVGRRQATVSRGVQWNGSLVRQMLCKITASLRARATRALFVPNRLAIFAAKL